MQLTENNDEIGTGAQVTAEVAESNIARLTGMQASPPKSCLLLVDGDPRSLRVMDVSLKKAGFAVTTAANGVEALAVLGAGPPDLVISDTHMAGMDGFELCRRMKQRPEWARIPFIFLSSRTSIEEKIRGLELGVEDYLLKPIYIKEITTRVKMLLQRVQRERLESRRDVRTKFAGQLADIGVVDLVQTIEINRKSGIIHIENRDGRRGAIYFRDGRAIDAEAGRLSGAEALYRLFSWADGSFEVEFKTIRRPDAIELGPPALLMEGMRRLDEWARLLEVMPPLDTVLEVDFHLLAERLADLPDEVNGILRLFDGRRSIQAVIEDSDFPDLEALTVIGRFHGERLIHAVNREARPASESAAGLERWLAHGGDGASGGAAPPPAKAAIVPPAAAAARPPAPWRDSLEVRARSVVRPMPAAGQELDTRAKEAQGAGHARPVEPAAAAQGARGEHESNGESTGSPAEEATPPADASRPDNIKTFEVPPLSVAGDEGPPNTSPAAQVTARPAGPQALPGEVARSQTTLPGLGQTPAPSTVMAAKAPSQGNPAAPATSAREPRAAGGAKEARAEIAPEVSVQHQAVSDFEASFTTPDEVPRVAPRETNQTRVGMEPVVAAAGSQPHRVSAEDDFGTGTDGGYTDDLAVDDADARAKRLKVALVAGGAAVVVVVALLFMGRGHPPAAPEPPASPGSGQGAVVAAPEPAAAGAGAPAPPASPSAQKAIEGELAADTRKTPAGAGKASSGEKAAETPPAVDLPGGQTGGQPGRAPAAGAAVSAEFDGLKAECEKAFRKGAGKYKDIAASCGQALMANPAAADVMLMLAHAELDRGKNMAEALGLATRAVETDPTLVEAYVLIGGAEQVGGRRAEAKAAYKKYLELAPSGKYASDVRAILKSL